MKYKSVIIKIYTVLCLFLVSIGFVSADNKSPSVNGGTDTGRFGGMSSNGGGKSFLIRLIGYRITFTNKKNEIYEGTRPVDLMISFKNGYNFYNSGITYLYTNSKTGKLEINEFNTFLDNNKSQESLNDSKKYYRLSDTPLNSTQEPLVVSSNVWKDNGNTAKTCGYFGGLSFDCFAVNFEEYLKNSFSAANDNDFGFPTKNFYDSTGGGLLKLLYLFSTIEYSKCNSGNSGGCAQRYTELKDLNFSNEGGDFRKKFDDFTKDAYLVFEPIFASSENKDITYVRYTAYEYFKHVSSEINNTDLENVGYQKILETNSKTKNGRTLSPFSSVADTFDRIACFKSISVSPSSSNIQAVSNVCNAENKKSTYYADIFSDNGFEHKGYGFGYYSINMFIQERIINLNNCLFEVNSCDDFGHFGITASSLNYNCVEQGAIGANYFQKVDGNVQQKAYCYDSFVGYSFANTLNFFKNNSIDTDSGVDIPDGKFYITRNCIYNAAYDQTNYNIDSFSFKQGDIKNVYLSFAGNTYEFEPDLDNIYVGSPSQTVQTDIANSSLMYKVSTRIISIPMKLKSSIWLSNKLLPSDSAEEEYDAQIYLSQSGNDLHELLNVETFNKELFNKFQSASTVGFSEISGGLGQIQQANTFWYNLGYDSDSLGCNFKIKLKKSTLCDPSIENCTVLDNLKFRVISLSYPFPSKDGNSRLPGVNWLDSENYVYKYITNNRNVQGSGTRLFYPEMMYVEKEPLYTINLDTSSMINIRQYNKTHTYKNINSELSCTSGKCISNFLRTDSYFKNTSGACFDVTSSNTDLYYSCADKTEESGGRS